MKNKKKEQKEQKDTSLHWCYVGENQEYVVMTCTREDWETIRKAVEVATNYQIRNESDMANYSYTRENR